MIHKSSHLKRGCVVLSYDVMPGGHFSSSTRNFTIFQMTMHSEEHVLSRWVTVLH